MTDAGERLTRVEEAQAFTDRTVEHLHEETLRLAGIVERLEKRLARLEEASRNAAPAPAPDADDPLAERPPHSYRSLDSEAPDARLPGTPPGAE